MTPTRTSSTSSTDAAVPGFRVTRLIGRGSAGAVYEAVQESLDRPVALRIVDDERLAARLPRLRWPEHRGVVSMYSSGRLDAGGGYIAMRLVPGRSLAARKPAPHEALSLLEQVASALDAAHAQGFVHGGVRASNVLVEHGGRALLSDFGLGPEQTSADSDRRQFATLVQELVGGEAPAHAASAEAMVREVAARLPPRRRRISPPLAAACVAGAAVVAGLAIVLRGGGGDEAPGPPSVAPGARELGSALTAGEVRTVDCEGRAPGGASQACLVVQTGLPGRPVQAARSGAVRRWAVRGAQGQLALAVLRRRGRRFVWIARSDLVRVPDGKPRAFPADLPIRAGDFVGLVVTPGSGLGVARAGGGARTVRWLGRVQVPILASLSVVRGASTAFAVTPRRELLLRADYVPGARPRVPGLLTGPAARSAPAGQPLGSRNVEVRPGLIRRPVVARVGDGVVLDLFNGPVRLTRVTVSSADPAGSLIDLRTYGKPVMRLRWLNPEGEVIVHDYAVGARSLRPRS